MFYYMRATTTESLKRIDKRGRGECHKGLFEVPCVDGWDRKCSWLPLKNIRSFEACWLWVSLAKDTNTKSTTYESRF